MTVEMVNLLQKHSNLHRLEEVLTVVAPRAVGRERHVHPGTEHVGHTGHPGREVHVAHRAVHDSGAAARHESFMVKIAGTELGFRVADRCMQVHGGIGLATELPISKMWRDARSFMITEGPVEVMRMVLAREIFREHN